MTGLCQIPGCRIRGRHLPACQDDRCGGCLPRVAHGLVCDACLDRARRRLDEIITLTPDARLVAAGLVRHGSGAGGGKPASRSPINDDATDRLDEIQNALTTTARDIAETRGLAYGRDGRSRPLSASVAAQNGELVPTSTPEPLEAK